MTANIDTTTGRAAIAFVGETPWHGLGQHLPENADMATWRREAGLDWEAQSAPVQYVPRPDTLPATSLGLRQLDGRKVLYRSDTKAGLAVVSDRYKPVQPRDVMDFYADLCQRYGFTMETAGALRGGRIIWALANTGLGSFALPGTDVVRQYVLLATSYDGSMATTGRLTSVRVVCNNTLDAAQGDKPLVSLSHRSTFNAEAFRAALGFDQWAVFKAQAQAMAATPVKAEQSVEFFMQVYHGLRADAVMSPGVEKSVERTVKRLAEQYLGGAPGADLPSAKGTVWGLLNAVTHDIDYQRKARDQGARLLSSWFGDGNAVKARALKLAVELAHA